jgi:hypothetical protein
MAYVYQVSFDIESEQVDELRIGGSLERVLGYLRILLPSETGYMTARAMYSMDDPERTHLIFESVWEEWEDLTRHEATNLAERKVLVEFAPHVDLGALASRVYREVD